MSLDFCTIDFETATHEKHSACEIGICVVENGEVATTKSWLIKPPSYPYFNYHNIAVHGIKPKDVEKEPTFEKIWDEVLGIISNKLLIAHNAAFDMGVLRSCLAHYNLPKPSIDYLCSIQIAKKSWEGLPSYSLGNLTNLHNIRFQHHRAGDDAEACAKISLLGFQKLALTSCTEIPIIWSKNMKKL